MDLFSVRGSDDRQGTAKSGRSVASTKWVSHSITYRPDTVEQRLLTIKFEGPATVSGDSAWFANVIKSHPRVFPRILFNTKFDATTQAFYMQNKFIINEFAFIGFKRQI